MGYNEHSPTSREIDFVRHLGRWNKHFPEAQRTSKLPYPDIKVLKEYRKQLMARDNLDGIDREKVLEAVSKMIRGISPY